MEEGVHAFILFLFVSFIATAVLGLVLLIIAICWRDK